jgi:hypothetical protein
MFVLFVDSITMLSQQFLYNIELCSNFILLGCFASLLSSLTRLYHPFWGSYYGNTSVYAFVDVDVPIDTTGDSTDSDFVSDSEHDSDATTLDIKTCKDQNTNGSCDQWKTTSVATTVILTTENAPNHTYLPGLGARPKTVIHVYEPPTVPLTPRTYDLQCMLPSSTMKGFDDSASIDDISRHLMIPKEDPNDVETSSTQMQTTTLTLTSLPESDSQSEERVLLLDDTSLVEESSAVVASVPSAEVEDSRASLPRTDTITSVPQGEDWERRLKGKHAKPYLQPDAKADMWLPYAKMLYPMASTQGRRYREKNTPLKNYLSKDEEIAQQQLLDRHLRHTILRDRQILEQQVRDIKQAQCSMTLPYHWDTYDEVQQLVTESCHFPGNLETEKYTQHFMNILEHLRTLPDPPFPNFPNLHLYREITNKAFVEVINKLLQNTKAIHFWNRHLLKRFAVLHQAQSAEIHKLSELNATLKEKLLHQQRKQNTKITAICDTYLKDLLARIQKVEDIALDTQRQCRTDIKQIFRAHDNAVSHNRIEFDELHQNFSDVATRVITLATDQMEYAAKLDQNTTSIETTKNTVTVENQDVVELFAEGNGFLAELSAQRGTGYVSPCLSHTDDVTGSTHSPQHHIRPKSSDECRVNVSKFTEPQHDTPGATTNTNASLHTPTLQNTSDWDTPEQPYSEQHYTSQPQSRIRDGGQTYRDSYNSGWRPIIQKPFKKPWVNRSRYRRNKVK